ncbi:MAG: diacylglycerol kinase family lipid kinase [Firmicutes bacterium]|nr:diacylglycerol kinase family lipid kinase [Bacillota bacterium]
MKVVLNPRAGRGRAGREEDVASAVLSGMGVDFEIERTTGPGGAVEVARRAVESGFDTVAAMGGDGTTNEVVNGIAGTGATLGLIPCGTGNDFAVAMGIPKDVREACRILAAGKTRRVDLGRVNDKYFISTFGVGFDARVTREVNQGFKFARGILVYILAVMKVIWTYAPERMHLVVDGEEVVVDAPLLVAVANWQSYGGGMRICPEASVDDGVFDVCVVANMSKLRFLQSFPRVISGTHVRLPEVRIVRAKSVRIKCGRMEPFHIDGEVFDASEMEFTLLPEGMSVIAGEV